MKKSFITSGPGLCFIIGRIRDLFVFLCCFIIDELRKFHEAQMFNHIAEAKGLWNK